MLLVLVGTNIQILFDTEKIFANSWKHFVTMTDTEKKIWKKYVHCRPTSEKEKEVCVYVCVIT
jgi:hypothetical protein